MDVNRPNTAEGNESGDRLQLEPEKERGEIDQSHRVDRVDRVFSMSGEPVEVFGAVMDGMKPPEEAYPVLQSVAPIHEKIAEQHGFHCLYPPWLRGDCRAKTCGDDDVDPSAKLRQQPENHAAPEKILSEKETQIGPPCGSQETLTLFRRKLRLKWAKDSDEEEEADACRNNQSQDHIRSPWRRRLLSGTV